MRGDIYENFAGRLIFPILDTRERVIGFGGRVLDNSLPKYVNSPENALYHKGSNLYGLNVAKKETVLITAYFQYKDWEKMTEIRVTVVPKDPQDYIYYLTKEMREKEEKSREEENFLLPDSYQDQN